MSSINSDDLHRMFKKLDKNEDGRVSIDELKWLLDGVGLQTSLKELETLVGNQTLDLVDFWTFYDIISKRHEGDRINIDKEEEEKKLEKELVESFKVFDVNGDGFISCEEVESMLSRLGLWDGDCRSMIEFYDSNGDGLLDFDEFKNIMVFSNPKSLLAAQKL